MFSAVHSPRAIFRRQRQNLEAIVEELDGQGCLLLATPRQDHFTRALRDGPNTNESLGGGFRLRDLRKQHKGTDWRELHAGFFVNTCESPGYLLSRSPRHVVQRLQWSARGSRARVLGYIAHDLVKDLRHWLWVGLYGWFVWVVCMVWMWVWVKMRFRGSTGSVRYLYVIAVSLSGVVAIRIIPIAPVTF
jgi:hypothetical protein